MLKKMKQQLIENIKKAGERGELTAHQVYDISHDSVAQAAQKLKGEAEELREFMKEAVTTTVQTLVDAEEASEKNISAALHGAVDGIKQVESRTLHAAHEELGQVKKHLKEEEGKFAGIVNEVFLGAKEAAEDFSGEVKVNIETALADAKLKSVELLGLTRDTVKDAVHKAIDTETKLEETVVGITRDATAKALGEVRLTGKRARKVSESVLSAAVEAAEELGRDVKETASAAAEGVRLGPPISRPSKIICIGLNYADHAREAGAEIPKEPVVFFKASSALSGPDDDVVLPRGSSKTDWEVELAFVVGRRARYVTEAEALAHVAGYAVHNDYSEREHQIERGGQWVKGKSADTFAPLGPFLTTPDEVGDVGKLGLWLTVNGESRQKGSTASMVFGVAEILSYLSQFMTLLPGDLVSTGTPPGVGLGFDPPLFLKAGDVVECGIEGLGRQRQTIVPSV